MANCNLGKVNLESMHPANMHARWQQGLALPCADESAIFTICLCFAFVVVCSALFHKENLLSCPSHPCWKSEPSMYCIRYVFPLKLLQCGMASWWPQTGLVPAHRVVMETTLLCFILAQGPHQAFLAPVPRLIYWQ